jgi:hypothetical protein
VKLRRYHRWLAPLFALLLLWIAVTGLTIQFIKLSTPPRPGPPPVEEASLIPAARAHEHEASAKPAAVKPASAATPAAAPESETDRIRRERHDLSEFVMDLHSGKSFGPLGTWLSIASGFALIFLAGSGLWMYVQMFRARTRDGRTSSGGKYFW